MTDADIASLKAQGVGFFTFRATDAAGRILDLMPDGTLRIYGGRTAEQAVIDLIAVIGVGAMPWPENITVEYVK